MQGEHQTRGGDQLGLRAYNKRMILNLIRQNGALLMKKAAPAPPNVAIFRRISC